MSGMPTSPMVEFPAEVEAVFTKYNTRVSFYRVTADSPITSFTDGDLLMYRDYLSEGA